MRLYQGDSLHETIGSGLHEGVGSYQDHKEYEFSTTLNGCENLNVNTNPLKFESGDSLSVSVDLRYLAFFVSVLGKV